MPRAPLFSRKQSGGVFLVNNESNTTGEIFFVNSVTGSSTSGGKNPDAPLATIAQAMALCTAAKGDTIYLMPGHVETCIAAGTVTASVAGVRIIGIGSGRNRARINYTTAVGASFDITAANVLVKNVFFTMIGFDNITAGVNISGADCVIEDCEFENADATNQAALCILTAAGADRLVIQRCHFHGTADAGTAAAVRIVAGNNVVIQDNIFHGAYTTTLGAIDNSAAVTNLQISRNKINNLTAASAKGVFCHASSTGQISGNYVQILTGTAPFAGAAMSWAGGNYYSATIATAGTLV